MFGKKKHLYRCLVKKSPIYMLVEKREIYVYKM